MQKHFFFMTALLMGLVIAVSSCKDSKKADADENGSEKVEKIQKLTKINSAADLDNLDMDNLDLDDLAKLDDLEGLDDLNFDELTESQANNLLKVMMLLANKDMPEIEDEDVKLKGITMEGDDITFGLEMSKEALKGMPISMLEMVLNSPELKEAMMTEMVGGITSGDDDMDSFFKVIIAAKKNFCLKFIDGGNGESAVCRLEGEEMAKLMNAAKETEE